MKPPKDWCAIPGADSNNTYQVGGTAYFRRIGEFIKKRFLRDLAHIIHERFYCNR